MAPWTTEVTRDLIEAIATHGTSSELTEEAPFGKVKGVWKQIQDAMAAANPAFAQSALK